VDVERDGLELVPYGEVFEVGMRHLADALEVSRENAFTLPEEWFNGLTVTSEDLERWIHSFKAQFLSQVARSPGERGQVDWARVLEHVEQGIVEDAYLPGDDEGGWWHRQIRYGHDPVWGRVDMLVLAPADTTAAWEEWLASWHSDGDGDWWDRAPFVIETSDRRIHAPGEPEEPGTDFAYRRPSIIGPDPMATHPRGSHYRAIRYDDWLDLDSPWPMLTLREMDFLRAEALLRVGRQGEAAQLINRTRVERGGWEPVEADDPDLGRWTPTPATTGRSPRSPPGRTDLESRA
jgi:hypothetical protein